MMRLFGYQLKLLYRDRQTMFWTLFFPLILATFFQLAFSQLNSSEQFEPARLAVVEIKKDQNLQTLLEGLSHDKKDPLLKLQYTSLQNAKVLLEDEKIDGYLIMDQKLNIVVKSNGIAQTIIQTVVDSYLQGQHTIETIAKKDFTAFQKIIQDKLDMQTDYFKTQQITSADITVIYFYTLIGMTCMYGSFWGMRISSRIEANLSRQGTRIHIAPISKWKLAITGTIAALICQYLSALLLMGYLIFGLHVDFGTQIGPILLLMALGSYVGVIIGYLVGTLFHCQENKKISILSSSTLLLSFLSGMMIVDMKYWIQEYVPILSYINPVNLITDALYALYYYPTYERYCMNIIILGVIGICLTLISILILRRKKYDSI